MRPAAGRYLLRSLTAQGWVWLAFGSRTRVIGELARLPPDQLVEVWTLLPEGWVRELSGKAWAVLAQLTGWDWRRIGWRWPWQSRGRVWWRPWER